MRHEYRELKIWQDARELTKIVYETSRKFPSEEKFGLTSQIRRATISIASNISEGSSYRTDSMFLRFLDVALGVCVKSRLNCIWLLMSIISVKTG